MTNRKKCDHAAVIEAVERDGKSLGKVALEFGLSKSTVQSIIRRARENVAAQEGPRAGGQGRKLNDEMRQVLVETLREAPFSKLASLRRMCAQNGVDVSEVTIRSTIMALGFRFKGGLWLESAAESGGDLDEFYVGDPVESALLPDFNCFPIVSDWRKLRPDSYEVETLPETVPGLQLFLVHIWDLIAQLRKIYLKPKEEVNYTFIYPYSAYKYVSKCEQFCPEGVLVIEAVLFDLDCLDDSEKASRNFHAVWRRRILFATERSLDALVGIFSSPDAWRKQCDLAEILRGLLTAAALANGYSNLADWELALEESKKKAAAARVKGGKNRWSNDSYIAYRKHIVELAKDYQDRNHDADIKKVVRAIEPKLHKWVSLQDWEDTQAPEVDQRSVEGIIKKYLDSHSQ